MSSGDGLCQAADASCTPLLAQPRGVIDTSCSSRKSARELQRHLIPEIPPAAEESLFRHSTELSWVSPACLTPITVFQSPYCIMGDPREYSVQPRIRYNTVGGVNGPLVILDNVG